MFSLSDFEYFRCVNFYESLSVTVGSPYSLIDLQLYQCTKGVNYGIISNEWTTPGLGRVVSVHTSGCPRSCPLSKTPGFLPESGIFDQKSPITEDRDYIWHFCLRQSVSNRKLGCVKKMSFFRISGPDRCPTTRTRFGWVGPNVPNLCHLCRYVCNSWLTRNSPYRGNLPQSSGFWDPNWACSGLKDTPGYRYSDSLVKSRKSKNFEKNPEIRPDFGPDRFGHLGPTQYQNILAQK